MDFNLNHSGDMLEDLLGNDREMTIALRDAFRSDSRTRFRITAILGGLFGFLGLFFMLIMPFIPIIVDLWFMGMAVGMFLAGALGLLLSMPMTDSVSVHLKVINYVDNVIKNTEYRRPNLMDDPKDDEEPEEEVDEETEEDAADEEEDEEEDGTGTDRTD